MPELAQKMWEELVTIENIALAYGVTTSLMKRKIGYWRKSYPGFFKESLERDRVEAKIAVEMWDHGSKIAEIAEAYDVKLATMEKMIKGWRDKYNWFPVRKGSKKTIESYQKDARKAHSLWLKGLNKSSIAKELGMSYPNFVYHLKLWQENIPDWFLPRKIDNPTASIDAKNVAKLKQFLRDNDRIVASDVVRILEVDRFKATKYLKYLVGQGVLLSRGEGRSTFYQLAEDGKRQKLSDKHMHLSRLWGKYRSSDLAAYYEITESNLRTLIYELRLIRPDLFPLHSPKRSSIGYREIKASDLKRINFRIAEQYGIIWNQGMNTEMIAVITGGKKSIVESRLKEWVLDFPLLFMPPDTRGYGLLEAVKDLYAGYFKSFEEAAQSTGLKLDMFMKSAKDLIQDEFRTTDLENLSKIMSKAAPISEALESGETYQEAAAKLGLSCDSTRNYISKFRRILPEWFQSKESRNKEILYVAVELWPHVVPETGPGKTVFSGRLIAAAKLLIEKMQLEDSLRVVMRRLKKWTKDYPDLFQL